MKHAEAILTATEDLYRELAADVREVIADLDRATEDERTSRQHIIECVRARLVELVGEPEPAAPPALTLARPGFDTPGAPFDHIAITHPDGTTERLDVPEPFECPHAEGCRLGPHRWAVTLHAAGYEEVGTPDNAPEGARVIERITEGN